MFFRKTIAELKARLDAAHSCVTQLMNERDAAKKWACALEIGRDRWSQEAEARNKTIDRLQAERDKAMAEAEALKANCTELADAVNENAADLRRARRERDEARDRVEWFRGQCEAANREIAALKADPPRKARVIELRIDDAPLRALLDEIRAAARPEAD